MGESVGRGHSAPRTAVCVEFWKKPTSHLLNKQKHLLLVLRWQVMPETPLEVPFGQSGHHRRRRQGRGHRHRFLERLMQSPWFVCHTCLCHNARDDARAVGGGRLELVFIGHRRRPERSAGREKVLPRGQRQAGVRLEASTVRMWDAEKFSVCQNARGFLQGLRKLALSFVEHFFCDLYYSTPHFYLVFCILVVRS